LRVLSAFVLIGALTAADDASLSSMPNALSSVQPRQNREAGARGFVRGRLVGPFRGAGQFQASDLTEAVVGALPPVLPAPGRAVLIDPATTNTIDTYTFKRWRKIKSPPLLPHGYEFIRRITLDLTGRNSAASQVASFVNVLLPIKRSKYVESLLATPQWVDKWTMYFGDFFQNNSEIRRSSASPTEWVAFKQLHSSFLSSNNPTTRWREK